MKEDQPGLTIGIFARTFPRSTFRGLLNAVVRSSFRVVQLNLVSAGLETLPASLSSAQVAELAKALISRRIRVAALSGTFNMIDPDASKRREGLRRLGLLASECHKLGTRTITLCTGTRDHSNMWRHHPDNDLAPAWEDLLESMREAVKIAEAHDVMLAFEPEVGNVVDSAAKARRLLDEVGSPFLKVVLDVANLIRAGDLPRMQAIIDDAFDLLSPDIALVHAKEIGAEGSVGDLAPGQGVLDFARIATCYHEAGLDVPIIVHGLPESSVVEARWHLIKTFAFAATVRTYPQDGVLFRYVDRREEPLVFVFQHGLGGDVSKMYDLVDPPSGVRFVSFDARYHGLTRPLGPPGKIGFDVSADDLLALLDHLGVEKAVIGGLSMGAGIALNFATRHPERMIGLVLSRPAWVDEPFPENLRLFPEMAALIHDLGAKAAREAFRATDTYAKLLAESTDSASAMLGMFDDPAAEETLERFERIPRDCPSRDRAAWRAIAVPTLVLANHQDPIHPYAMGLTLASIIPRADLRLLTPKCVSVEQHERDFNQHVHDYFNRHFPTREGGPNASQSEST